MKPKFKIGDWVKTRKNKIRKILDIQKNIQTFPRMLFCL